MRKSRWLLAGLVYAGLVAGGIATGHWLTDLLEMDLRPSTEPRVHAMLMVATGLYMLAAATPFVPGAEIGAILMISFGKPIVLLVYTTMVAALLTAFLIGRLVPATLLASVFGFLGLQRARTFVEHMHALPSQEKLSLLVARAPNRIVPALLRHRYAAVALVLNLPGNTLLGGGGGIALLAGMSRLFTTFYFTAAVLVAVSPIPLLVLLTGYQPLG